MSHKHTSLASKESVRKNPKVHKDEYYEEEEVEYNVFRHEHVSMTIEYDEEGEVVRRGSSNHGSHGKGNHDHSSLRKSNSHGRRHSKHDDGGDDEDDDDDEYSKPYGKATTTHVASDYETPHSRGHAKSKKSNHHHGHSKQNYDDDDEYSEPYGMATVTHVAPDY